MTDFAEPVVIVSDVHLSARSDWRQEIEGLRGLWQRAATVIFNGDTIGSDLSRQETKRREVIDRIQTVCRADGAQAVLLGGNSDAQLDGPRHVFLAAGRVVVFHGDVLFDSISPWSRGARRLAAARVRVLRNMAPERCNTLEGQQASVRASLQMVVTKDLYDYEGITLAGRFRWILRWLTRPGLIPATLRAWYGIPALAVRFLERFAGQARCAILGHTHHAGIWRVGEKTVTNTGSLRGPGRSLVVQVGYGEIVVRALVEGAGSYLRGQIVRRISIPGCP